MRVMHASETPDRLFDLRRVDRAAFSVLQALLTRKGASTAFPLEGGSS